MYAQTPTPPYYAVIFCSVRTEAEEGYALMADKMMQLAKQQKGFLGVETAQNELGITISYWDSLTAIQNWKNHAYHSIAQQLGQNRWYRRYKIRIAKVERDYEFELP